MLRIAAECHDFGKLDVNFQNKIRKAIKEAPLQYGGSLPEIPHNFLSGALIDIPALRTEFDEEEVSVILRAVYFHHDRTPTELSHKEQRQYITDNLLYGAEQYTSDGIKPLTSAKTAHLRYSLPPSDDEPEYIKIKGLLNRIDYCASAGVPIEIPPSTAVSEKTERFLMTRYGGLRELQKFMRDNSEKNVVVTAATGSGKTEAALLWNGSAKGFYTLPLKISINAVFERIQSSDGIAFDECAILHSDAFSYYLGVDESPLFKYSCAKNLSMPLTICTVDQLLKFVYRYNGSEIQLATLSYSKVVIDEIQTYSPELLGTIIYALKMVSSLGGRFAVITATFPPLLRELLSDIEIKYSPNYYGSVSRRHRISLIDGNEFNIDEIAENGQTKKILVIVNTVSRAQQLYEMMKDFPNVSVHLLHSMFLKKDRAALEKEIMRFARNGSACDDCGIWISTQIVEASLDIDFDMLYTEMCTVDSLLQRLGRVFRSRDYFEDEPNVYILNNRNGVGKLIDDEIYEWSVEALRIQLNDNSSVLLTEADGCDMKQAMIDYVYGENRKNSEYCKKIKAQITRLKNIEWYTSPKKEVDKVFRDIDSKTLIPVSVYNDLLDSGKAEEWRRALNSGTALPSEKQRIKDEIAGYTVSISHYHGLDIGHESVLYPYSGIYVYNGDYDFDTASLSGNGLIKNYSGRYSAEQLII